MGSLKSRNDFSIIYLFSAGVSCREAFTIERSGTSYADDEAVLAHRAHVVSAITFSAAALEAMINQLFLDAIESPGSIEAVSADARSNLADARSNLAKLWHEELRDGGPILAKFELAHRAVTGRMMKGDDVRWGKAQWVVRLRNAFVHFEPSWEVHNARPGVAQGRRGYKFAKLRHAFPQNPLCGTGTPFYPDKLLGHGCAEWSVKSALGFADHFWKKIGAKPSYDSYRAMFRTR